jgi:subtilisin family serine protease
MIESRWEKLLTIFGSILALNFIFFTFASAKDLNMVVKKKDIPSKLSSSLGELKKEYEKRAMASQTYAQSRSLRTEYPDKVTVYLISEPGTIIDEGSLQAYGAEIIKSADNVWKVKAPINMIETIADNVEGIAFIKLPDKGIPSAIESEGVGLTGASSYHSAGHTGSGVKVAVIDIGFAGLSSAISDGELPNTVVSIDCTGSSCIPTDFSSETDLHGTAVAEIVHDMAPESTLHLIKISDTLDLKDANDYAIANGIKIINHSVSHFNNNFYSGECYNSNSVCTANNAYINGILWVNAMGNMAKKHYGATFTDSDGDEYHDVAAGDDETINIEANAGDIIDVYLTWEAWPTTDQDYDLGLYDSDLNLVASSETSQTGTQPPTEAIYYSVPANDTYHLAIYKYSATSDHRLAVFSLNHHTDPAAASNSITSPADATDVLAVGAIDYSNWFTGPQESFSSQGPCSDGSTKPEISGPDNTTSYTYGHGFSGTSAASPHVAGAAALILSNNPTYSVSQLWNALTSSAVDMGSSGQDNIYGYGRLNLPGVIFSDVLPDHWAESFINTIYENGITSGCSQDPLMYCPDYTVTRAQMAVFLERGINGSDYDPPGATGIFDDCPVSHWAADWVEQFYADGITSGCSANPMMYCPDDLVTRAQMAVFLLRSMYGNGYTPPSAVGIFDDVPVTHWAADWIETLHDEGITGGCSTNPPLYCPDDVVNRAQMAVFIVRAFDL